MGATYLKKGEPGQGIGFIRIAAQLGCEPAKQWLDDNNIK
jgi:hypothetical protein